MVRHVKETWIKLSGHPSLAGIAHQMESIFTLHEQEHDKEKHYQIDCCKMRYVNRGILQFIYVWMQCAGMRGINAKLVNLTDEMRHALNVVTTKDTHYELHYR